MSTDVLVHGSGSDSFSWQWVTPLLEQLGHDVVAPDLRCDDESADMNDDADVVVEAIAGRSDLVVGQSLAG